MRKLRFVAFCLAVVMSLSMPLSAQKGPKDKDKDKDKGEKGEGIQLGPRPFFLVQDMDESQLKKELMDCFDDPVKRTEFSIGHRGAALMFPEHTREAYEAGARMGAGIVECDVTFTKDKELVCRHAQNDLATTTNILVTPLAGTCIKPFKAATFAPDGTLLTPASAECRTSEITLAEFKTLRGKMDASNPACPSRASRSRITHRR
jgi:glycerophosphoryl diester phosphodiesterase